MISNPLRSTRAVRMIATGVFAWLLLVALPSFTGVRAWLMAPLYLHNTEASGDLAYVMADGDAYLERLIAASDLYHMRRIQSIYILNERTPSNYNYKSGHSQTKVESATGYLQHYGVPASAIHYVEQPNSAWMSSLSEAQALSQCLPEDAQQVVVVTSAPHTRRSLLCFQRSLPPQVSATPFAASPPAHSAELFKPIWQEYAKLFLYILFA